MEQFLFDSLSLKNVIVHENKKILKIVFISYYSFCAIIK